MRVLAHAVRNLLNCPPCIGFIGGVDKSENDTVEDKDALKESDT